MKVVVVEWWYMSGSLQARPIQSPLRRLCYLKPRIWIIDYIERHRMLLSDRNNFQISSVKTIVGSYTISSEQYVIIASVNSMTSTKIKFISSVF